MRAREAAEHLPYNERRLIALFGDREFDMPEIVSIRDKWLRDNLELLDRFFFREEYTELLINDLMKEV